MKPRFSVGERAVGDRYDKASGTYVRVRGRYMGEDANFCYVEDASDFDLTEWGCAPKSIRRLKPRRKLEAIEAVAIMGGEEPKGIEEFAIKHEGTPMTRPTWELLVILAVAVAEFCMALRGLN